MLAKVPYWPFHRLSLLGTGATRHFVSGAQETTQWDATPIPLAFKALPRKTQTQVFSLWEHTRLRLRWGGVQQSESCLNGASLVSGRCSLICKSLFAYINSLQREKANMYFMKTEMTQTTCIIYICWKIQLLSANQIADLEKSRKYCRVGFLWQSFSSGWQLGWLLWEPAGSFPHVWQSQCLLAPRQTCCWPRLRPSACGRAFGIMY